MGRILLKGGPDRSTPLVTAEFGTDVTSTWWIKLAEAIGTGALVAAGRYIVTQWGSRSAG